MGYGRPSVSRSLFGSKDYRLSEVRILYLPIIKWRMCVGMHTPMSPLYPNKQTMFPSRGDNSLSSRMKQRLVAVACATAMAFTGVVVSPSPASAHALSASAAAKGRKVAAVAKAQIGDRYKFGAAGPHRFDCSGLIKYSFKRALGRNLPHKAAKISGMGRAISRSAARPGDIVYWGSRGRAYHAGIVVSKNPLRIVDAPGRGRKVMKRAPWRGAHYIRIIR